LYPPEGPDDIELKRTNTTDTFEVYVRDGDDLGLLFVGVPETYSNPTLFSNIICTISNIAFVHDKDNETETETVPQNLGQLTGLPSSVYWRHHAFSLPHRVKYNRTTTYYGQSVPSLQSENMDHDAFRDEAAFSGSVATTCMRVEMEHRTQVGGYCHFYAAKNDSALDDDHNTESIPTPNSLPLPSIQPSKSSRSISLAPLTIGITTCKRLHFFLATFNALKEVYSTCIIV
jgi:hypothetical protein